MKQFVLILCFFFFHIVAYSQKPKPEDFKGFPPVYIGDPIFKFKDSVVCHEAYLAQEPFSDTAKCQAYRFIPDQKVGPTKFNSVLILLDTAKKVNSTMYYIQYDGKNQKAKAKSLDKDFADLARFFDAFFPAPGQKKLHPENNKVAFKSMVWKNGFYCVTLEKLRIDKTGDYWLNLIVARES